MREIPAWSVKVQTKMLKVGMTKKALAAKIGCNYNQLVNVMSGLVINESLRKKIENYFGKE
jgi:hypothetical protein